MAIKLPNGRIMRTLPEQVDKNMQDIATINNEVNIIKEGITSAYKIRGNATVASLNANIPDAAMNGYVYNMTDAGYLINSDESTTSVQIGDNVVLVWNDGNYHWDRLSGVVDTSNLVTLDSDQEITGEKSFTKNIKIGDRYIGFNGTYFTVRQTGNTNDCILVGDTVMYVRELKPAVSNIYDCGTPSNTWKDLYLNGTAFLNNIKAFIDGDVKIKAYNNADIISMSANSVRFGASVLPTYNGNQTLGLNTDNYRWSALYLKPTAPISDGTNSVTVAQISKTKLYKHQMTVSNVTGPVNVILTNNTPITGSFGANMSSQIVVAAYLTAQSNASQMKTPGGSLAQINNDGTITITVSAGETITNDTVTEL